MMKKIKLIPIISALLLSSSAFAADVTGFQGLELNSPITNINSAKLCNFHEVASESNLYKTYQCDDLNFAGAVTSAQVFSMDGKVDRLAIFFPAQQAVAVMNSLKAKYGSPSKSSSRAEFQRVDVVPGAVAIMWFAKNKVGLMLTNADGQQIAALIYTDASYEARLQKLTSEALAGSL